MGSMEEERQRQEAEAKNAGDGSGDAAEAPANAQSGDANAAASTNDRGSAKPSVGGAVGDMAEALDIDEEDEELLKALQMSMAMEEEDGDVAMAGDGGNDAADDGFVDDLLGGLPGMDEDDLNEIANMDELLEAVDDDKPDNDSTDKDSKKDDGKD